MLKISPKQCKAARALLDWLQSDLANASEVGITALCEFEKGGPIRTKSVDKIRQSFERAGVEFTEGEGVKLKENKAKVFHGFESVDMFFEELSREVASNGGDILYFISGHEKMCKVSKSKEYNNLKRVAALQKGTNIKCLIPETHKKLTFKPSFDMRMMPPAFGGVTNFYVYGNSKCAYEYVDDSLNFSFVLFDMVCQAKTYREHFESLWNMARPVQWLANDSEAHKPLLFASF
jgi:hypothetical protein